MSLFTYSTSLGSAVQKTILVSGALFLSGLFSLGTAFAQTDEHKGHDHSAHASSVKSTPLMLQQAAAIGTFTALPNDHMIGSADAPVTIIIYASVMCPHCATWFSDTWPAVKKDYVESHKIKVVFREFITAPAQLAQIGFMIANCAPKDQFFSLVEHQMQNREKIVAQVVAGKGQETYDKIAAKAGIINEKQMQACFNDKSNQAKIQQSMALAQGANLSSVPAFLINGVLHKGKSDYDNFSAVLDKTIKEATQ